MNLILLSGGSGKRLWPLSNDVRSKQFIKIFKKSDGTYESMVQRVYRQLKSVDPESQVTIATSGKQVSAIKNQLGPEVGISIEPCRRDTFPAIALATAYLADVQNVSRMEYVVVCPVDPYVSEEYFKSLKELETEARKQDGIMLMGMEPTYPSAKYGYIIPKTAEHISKVDTFKEKPSEEVAAEYIKQGALWNGGIFAYRIGYILDKTKEITGFDSYRDLFDNYDALTKISFDYAVVEKEKNLSCMRFSGEWKDLGTWNTLTEAMEEPVIGKGTLSENCENVHIINELDVPVIAMGLKDIVIASSPDGILVSDKEQSSYIKPLVDKLDERIMFAETSWGCFKIIDASEESLTIKVTLNAGHSMKYHSHSYRDEVWNVIAGRGIAVVDGVKTNVVPGDVIEMPRGCRHRIEAVTKLQLIEVQTGHDISIDDKQVYDFK